MMNKEQTISCPSPKIIAHNSNDEKVSTLQDSQYSIFADQRPTSYQPSTIIMVFVVVCGMLPLVFALSSTKLSIFTLVDLVLLATFTVTSRGRKIQLTMRGQLRCIQPSQTARRWTPYLSISVIVSFSVVGSYVGIV